MVEMVQLAKHSGTNAVEFIQTQAPDLARQIILFETFSNIVWIILSAVAMVAIFFLTKKAIKEDWDALPVIVALVDVIGGTLCIISFLGSVYSLLMVTLAPKVFLLQYIANLFRDKS